MQLSELESANDMLDSPGDLEERWEEQRCLLVRGALDAADFAEVIDQASAALERCGVAKRSDGLRWTGRTMPHIDETWINDIPALDDLVARFGAGSHPLCAVTDRVCGKPMRIWEGGFLVVTVPDDDAYVARPHQDPFATTVPGDARRLWIALTEISFGDGGLGLALGSHQREFPVCELPGFHERPRTVQGRVQKPKPVQGVDPELVGDHWHTAAMSPGDFLVFPPSLVHRGLPARSDRIRIALATVASAASDPQWIPQHSRAENKARLRLIRDLTASLDLSDDEVHRLNADLASVAIDSEAVHAALQRLDPPLGGKTL